ncbi:MAG: hypothetical protein J6T15_05120 [Bacilli bacterium]|nr:hypothetical protein [Bacilli bacterium]
MFGNRIIESLSEVDTDYNKLLDELTKVDYSCFYRGTVVDNHDPLNLGRVRVRIPQIYGSETQRNSSLYTPTSSIPFATSAIMVGAGNNTGSFLIPNIGDTVFVTFENEDPRLPIYFGGILTRDGTGKFIGTNDANDNNLYTVNSTEDFNTDITSEADRVIYKSLKGATIIISDKDGKEHISIVDQLGQRISLENTSGDTLGRERGSSSSGKTHNGRIVAQNSNGNTFTIDEGKIYARAPLIEFETDKFFRVGFHDRFPYEVAVANEILGIVAPVYPPDDPDSGGPSGDYATKEYVNMRINETVGNINNILATLTTPGGGN